MGCLCGLYEGCNNIEGGMVGRIGIVRPVTVFMYALNVYES